MFRTKADEAYENDPEFHRLVDMLETMLNDSRLTPSEVRMAAVLACCHREMNRTDAVYVEAQFDVDPERYLAPTRLVSMASRVAGCVPGRRVMYGPLADSAAGRAERLVREVTPTPVPVGACNCPKNSPTPSGTHDSDCPWSLPF